MDQTPLSDGARTYRDLAETASEITEDMDSFLDDLTAADYSDDEEDFEFTNILGDPVLVLWSTTTCNDSDPALDPAWISAPEGRES